MISLVKIRLFRTTSENCYVLFFNCSASISDAYGCARLIACQVLENGTSSNKRNSESYLVTVSNWPSSAIHSTLFLQSLSTNSNRSAGANRAHMETAPYGWEQSSLSTQAPNGAITRTPAPREDSGEFKLKFCTVCANNQNR